MVASVSVHGVAARAGVSVGTVSNVLNHPEKVSDATTQKVHAAITALRFIRNDAARQLRAGRSKTIGLVVFDARNPFFTELARGAEDQAAAGGLSVILGNSDTDTGRESTYLDLFEQQRVHGVLISPLGDVARRLERLRDLGMPAVIVDRYYGGSAFSSVSVDDLAGGALAVNHLIDLGKRSIAFVGGPMEIRQVADRVEGARRAAASRSDVSLEVIEINSRGVADGRVAGERILTRDRRYWPDGIFAANDLIALGLLQVLSAHDLRTVPRDIALIGYDDIDFASVSVVPLSSIRQPSALIGKTAVEILIEEAEDPTLAPRQVVFQPELIIRASTAGR